MYFRRQAYLHSVIPIDSLLFTNLNGINILAPYGLTSRRKRVWYPRIYNVAPKIAVV